VFVSALAGALGRSSVYAAERVPWAQVEDLRGTDTFAYDGEIVPATGALRLEKRPRTLVVYRPAVPGDEIVQQARLAAAAARYRGSERGRRLPADGGPSASAD
jgi:undecaprenyl-diphosphatase